jgi:hypothetical protein
MSYSAAQLLAISGIIQNTGLSVSRQMTAAIANLQSPGTVTGQLRLVAVNPATPATVITALRTKIPGLAMVAPLSYTTLDASIVSTDITGSVLNRANIFFSRGVRGFLGIFNAAVNACTISRNVLGSLYVFQSNGFLGISPDTTNHVDLATGGITSKFGPLAIGSQDHLLASTLYTGGQPNVAYAANATNIAASINAVADAIANLGSLYDFKKLSTVGTAVGIFTSLANQGLLSQSIQAALAAQGVSIANITAANENILNGVLLNITGNDLKTIIAGTHLIPANSITDGSQLLDAASLLSPSAINAIPGGTLKSLATQLISLNLNYSTTSQLINALKNLQIPNTTYLSALTQPVPDFDIHMIQNNFARGSGQFGSPLVQELIGTPGGFSHTSAAGIMLNTLISIASVTEVLAVQSACTSLLSAIGTGNTAAINAAANTLISAVNTLASTSAYSTALATMNTQVSNMITQLQLELVNCQLAGLDIYAATPGTTNSSLNTSILPSLANDPNKINVVGYLQSMTTNDVYGEAFSALLSEGQNNQSLSALGASNPGQPDLSQASLILNSLGGGGLTLAQRDNVINHARNHNLDIENSLENAALFGYNSSFYVSQGYPAA